MTNQQGAPEALRLADKLNSLCVDEFAWPTLNEAAIRLRRLHAENESLSAQVEAFSAAQAELAAMRAGGEPVAVVGNDFTLFWAGIGPIAPIIEKHGIKVGSPLYTHPQPDAQDAEPCPNCTPWPKGTQPALHPITGEPMGTDAQEATAWKLTAENLQRENVGLWKALKDAATSLETISRLAGRTNYVGEDGDQVETYMKHHDQVRRYANSRASVAREAIAGTAPAPMPSPTPQADSQPIDPDSEAFRASARLGLTLRFYGGCYAQSSMPGAQSAYEVVTGLEDAELGRIAMRFVDRAGDPHPGIDDAETICREFYAAMSEALDLRFRRRVDTARKQGATP